MLSRIGLVVFVLWLSVILVCWVNGSPPCWPLPISLAGLIPFSAQSGYASWYSCLALVLCGLAGWLVWRTVRRSRME